jgi:hypothetical protein
VEEYEQKYKDAQIKYMKKTCVEPVETKRRSSASNETVEKPILGRAFPFRGPTKKPISCEAGSLRFFCSVRGQ